MKKIFVVTLVSGIFYSCSCIPPDSRVLGRYKLISGTRASETINYRDSSLFLDFTLIEQSQGINEIKETVFRGETEIGSYRRVSVENFCKKDKFNVMYENGRKRRYTILNSNEFEASEYLLEGEADTVLYRYEAVN